MRSTGSLTPLTIFVSGPICHRHIVFLCLIFFLNPPHPLRPVAGRLVPEPQDAVGGGGGAAGSFGGAAPMAAQPLGRRGRATRGWPCSRSGGDEAAGMARGGGTTQAAARRGV